jgi:hypothetical protein
VAWFFVEVEVEVVAGVVVVVVGLCVLVVVGVVTVVVGEVVVVTEGTVAVVVVEVSVVVSESGNSVRHFRAARRIPLTGGCGCGRGCPCIP